MVVKSPFFKKFFFNLLIYIVFFCIGFIFFKNRLTPDMFLFLGCGFIVIKIVTVCKELFFHQMRLEVKGEQMVFTSYFNRLKTFELSDFYMVQEYRGRGQLFCFFVYHFRGGKMILFDNNFKVVQELAELRRRVLESDERLIFQKQSFFRQVEEQV